MPDLDKKASSDWREYTSRDGKKYVIVLNCDLKIVEFYLSVLYMLVCVGQAATKRIYISPQT